MDDAEWMMLNRDRRYYAHQIKSDPHLAVILYEQDTFHLFENHGWHQTMLDRDDQG